MPPKRKSDISDKLIGESTWFSHAKRFEPRDDMHPFVKDLTGKTYGSYLVIGYYGYRMPGRVSAWLCECQCGRNSIITSRSLNNHEYKGCSCGLPVGIRGDQTDAYDVKIAKSGQIIPRQTIDITGEKSGDLTVISYSRTYRNISRWICECSCGATLECTSGDITKQRRLTCGKHKVGSNIPPQVNDIRGQVFGRLTVIEYAGRKKSINGSHALWECLCECGNTKHITTNALMSGTKSCGCLQKEFARQLGARSAIPGYSAFMVKYRSCILSASSRGYAFLLTQEQAKTIFQMNCFYCGVEPIHCQTVRRTVLEDDVFIYNGLDRFDNNKGYELGNVLPCCGHCNFMKGKRTFTEFMEHINRFRNYQMEDVHEFLRRQAQ